MHRYKTSKFNQFEYWYAMTHTDNSERVTRVDALKSLSRFCDKLYSRFHATPRHATLRHATLRHATPRHATPLHTLVQGCLINS